MSSPSMSEDDFRAYVAGFNDNRFDQVGSRFWAEDIRVVLGGTTSKVVIEGRQACIDFFVHQRKEMAEHLTILSLKYGTGECELLAGVQFTAKKDFAEGFLSFPPITRGQGYRLNYEITYVFDKAGQISHITAKRMGEPEITSE